MSDDPVKMLLDDHEKFAERFRAYAEAEPFNVRREIFYALAAELRIHATIEEELFYPAVKQVSEQDELLMESVQEHHVIDLLIQELEDMNPVDQEGQDEFDAKFKVMKENVEHHLEEEELDMFPQAEECGLEPDLGHRMARRRRELESQRVYK